MQIQAKTSLLIMEKMTVRYKGSIYKIQNIKWTQEIKWHN